MNIWILNQSLEYATIKNDYKLCSKLIELGANVRYKNNICLFHAAENGYIQITKLLLQNGANINAEKSFAFNWACANGHIETIKLLIENGSKITNTGYEYAKFNGYYFICEYLDGFLTKNKVA
jgi:ankyrin repeat protein